MERKDLRMRKKRLDPGREEKAELPAELLSAWLWEDTGEEDADVSSFLQPDKTTRHKAAAIHRMRVCLNN